MKLCDKVRSRKIPVAGIGLMILDRPDDNGLSIDFGRPHAEV
jgi:hypothetical protein